MIAAFNDDQELIHDNLFLVRNASLSIGPAKLGQRHQNFLEIPAAAGS